MTALSAITSSRAVQKTTRIPGEAGIWVLVLGDMAEFALFFGTFMYARGSNPAAFAEGNSTLNLTYGALNTVLLLTSSLLVAQAVATSQKAEHSEVVRLLNGAFLCGIGFVAIKALEWSHLLQAGHSITSSQFYLYYFMFTGIHLVHVLIGLTALGRIRQTARRPEPTPHLPATIETFGIFWHMVDLLWIVLFALFYLIE
ncbi:cytochrome c oxidase subunit 3 [Mycolicibacterium llatzerense]|uniref:cytochrome c oxidase subunit 3 n=1 Tax=Mycolicibacterium llatzerense TaxID=280871 RepID=UPI0021B60869|nr:cytochrome c oxidase subunit 3 [Mycolicibacterium llatzerense]